ncbi:MAG TPA: hypothetical protein VK338_05860 [Candidatus Nitrosocosmicus sp.]|nr:hypothetical protein [Candidatus Nitrosocosmicus sp.]
MFQLDRINQFIEENKYRIEEKNSLHSRCIDGRYEHQDGLPALAKPGADVGDLVNLMSANREYALNIENDEIVQAFLETIGGWENFSVHTDTNHSHDEKLYYCRFFNQVSSDPEAFGIMHTDVEFIENLLKDHEVKFNSPILHGENQEQAVIIIKSNFYSLFSHSHNPFFQAFIYHKTLDNTRRRLLAKKILPYVKFEGVDLTEEYIYEITSQTADNQFLEVLSRIARNLPLIEAKIHEDGSFETIQLDTDEVEEDEDEKYE